MLGTASWRNAKRRLIRSSWNLIPKQKGISGKSALRFARYISLQKRVLLCSDWGDAIMTDREVSISALLNKLADGWSASHRSLLDEVILRWEKRFDTRVQVKDIDENICNFVTYLSKIRLRGMYRLPCLI